MSAPRRTTRRLALEQLDRRECPAGNVFALVSGGELRLNGDSRNNALAVWQGSNPGEYVVAGAKSAGDLNTTVNGQTAQVTFTGVTRVRFFAGGGDDKLVITNAAFPDISENINIRCGMGTGNDVVVFRGNAPPTGPDLTLNNGAAIPYGPVSTAGTLLFTGNEGNDALRINNATITRSVEFNGNDGNDLFQIDGIGFNHNLIGGLFLSMGEGDDLIRIARARVTNIANYSDGELQKSLRIELFNVRFRSLTGSGSTEVLVDSVADPAQYSTFENSLVCRDVITATVRRINAGGIGMFGGTGDDDISVSDATCDILEARLMDGDDELSLQNVIANNDTLLHGGPGTDTFNDLGGNQLNGLETSGFEN